MSGSWSTAGRRPEGLSPIFSRGVGWGVITFVELENMSDATQLMGWGGV